jgi:tetratricopeptide (TPR) repeat protein
MRSYALFLLLGACTSLATEEQDALASHQRNAALFFDGGRLNQAMGQIERGLELEPDDYKLNAMKGCILLRTSGSAQGTDHALLDQATEVLATQFATRSIGRHEPILLLNYGLALQKQGLRHLGEAIRLEGQAARAPAAQAPDMRKNAAEQRELAIGKLGEADTMLKELVERGELLRVAHNHRLQIALQRGDDEGFKISERGYFEQAVIAEKLTKDRIVKATNVDYENQELATLRELHAEEIGVRHLVAEFYYARRDFNAALAHLNRILSIDPRRFADYYNRGKVLLELRRDEEAKADFRRFLADPLVPTTSEKAVFALKAIEK